MKVLKIIEDILVNNKKNKKLTSNKLIDKSLENNIYNIAIFFIYDKIVNHEKEGIVIWLKLICPCCF